MQQYLLINGTLVKGKGRADNIVNPENGETITEIKGADRGQVDKAVLAAEKAFSSWSRVPPAERSGLLMKVADGIEKRSEEIARLEALDTGKPYARMLEDEIPAIVDCFRFYASACRLLTGSAAGEYFEGMTSMIRRDPVGVVAPDRPLELPLDDGGLENRPLSCSWELCRFQAFGKHPPYHAGAGAAF